MATMAARAQRNGLVRADLDDLLDRVAARLGIEVPPPAPFMRDPGLQPIVELERFRDMMRSIDAALEALHSEGEAPAGREEWSMQMLRDFAKQQGVKVPSESNHRKADLVAYLDSLDYDEDGNVVQEAEVDDDPEAQGAEEGEPAGAGPEADLGEPADEGPGAQGADRPLLHEVVHPAKLGTSTFDAEGREIPASAGDPDLRADDDGMPTLGQQP
jgi:hypothetical protein